MRVARESGLAVMVQFSAIWCPPCEKMERKVFTNRRLVELSEKYVFIHVDVDYDPATAARYGVRTVPTTVFLDPSGSVLARRDGVSDAGTLLRILEGLPQGLPARAAGADGR